jgi:hypothetical protein
VLGGCGGLICNFSAVAHVRCARFVWELLQADRLGPVASDRDVPPMSGVNGTVILVRCNVCPARWLGRPMSCLAGGFKAGLAKLRTWGF